MASSIVTLLHDPIFVPVCVPVPVPEIEKCKMQESGTHMGTGTKIRKTLCPSYGVIYCAVISRFFSYA